MGLLVLFPVVLFVPLLKMRFWLLSHSDIGLARLAYDLFRTDLFLFSIVVILGIIVPACKAVMSILCWYWFDAGVARRIFNRMAPLNKLAMLDVMLLSVSVVAFKGTGLGVVEIRYGLYIYLAFVVGSLGLSVAMEFALVGMRQVGDGEQSSCGQLDDPVGNLVHSS